MIRSIAFLAVLIVGLGAIATPSVFAQRAADEDVSQQEPPSAGASAGPSETPSSPNRRFVEDELSPFFEPPESAPKLADELNFRWTLSSGETIDVEKTFRQPWEELTSQLRRRVQGKPSSLIQVQSSAADSPRLMISRRGKTLDGPFASYSEEGKLVALVNYRQGKRDGILMTWDPSNRPLVFAEYTRGELDGFRCLFTACCESCKSGHLWLVQEWEAGELKRSHVVGAPPSQSKLSSKPLLSKAELDGGDDMATGADARPTDASAATKIITIDARYDAYLGSPTSIRSAMGMLSDFESRFDRDEDNLKRYVAKHYIQQRKAIVMRQNAASQANIEWLRQAYSQPPVFSGVSSVVLSGFV